MQKITFIFEDDYHNEKIIIDGFREIGWHIDSVGVLFKRFLLAMGFMESNVNETVTSTEDMVVD